MALKASARREPEHALPGARAPPEAAQAQGLRELPGAVLLPVHHRGHGLGVLHDDGHFTVPLAQHAAVVDVGRSWGWGTTDGDASVPRETLLHAPHYPPAPAPFVSMGARL